MAWLYGIIVARQARIEAKDERAQLHDLRALAFI